MGPAFGGDSAGPLAGSLLSSHSLGAPGSQVGFLELNQGSRILRNGVDCKTKYRIKCRTCFFRINRKRYFLKGLGATPRVCLSPTACLRAALKRAMLFQRFLVSICTSVVPWNALLLTLAPLPCGRIECQTCPSSTICLIAALKRAMSVGNALLLTNPFPAAESSAKPDGRSQPRRTGAPPLLARPWRLVTGLRSRPAERHVRPARKPGQLLASPMQRNLI